MYGDGSSGALNVASGTTNLLLDTKYQYTTVNVASGATLSTSSTVGSVLYILATTSIVIEGTVSLFNKVTKGKNTWSVVLDGTNHNSPSAQNGGGGGNSSYVGAGGVQNDGFGGGGAGGGHSAFGGAPGGNGGVGGSTPGVGGASKTGTANASGNAGGISSGGGGCVLSIGVSATGGSGGNAYNSNGSSGTGSSAAWGGGGGGAGGMAGAPGVHLVLKAPSVTVNGTTVLSGSTGNNGGNGGATGYDAVSAGSGGGGGGGGNSGSLYITSTSTPTVSPTILNAMNGGFISSGGTGYQAGAVGTAGVNGSVYTYLFIPSVDIPGPFTRVWDGASWVYSKTSVRDATAFKQTKIKVQ